MGQALSWGWRFLWAQNRDCLKSDMWRIPSISDEQIDCERPTTGPRGRKEGTKQENIRAGSAALGRGCLQNAEKEHFLGESGPWEGPQLGEQRFTGGGGALNCICNNAEVGF